MSHFRIVLAFFICFLAGEIKAQSLTPEVISAAGEHFSTTSASLSWTLGEPVIETFQNVSNVLTQGFHQDVYELTGMEELNKNITVAIYPNPTADKVTISFSQQDHGYNTVVITNMSGQEVKVIDVSKQNQVDVEVTSFSPGTYLITISDQFNKQTLTLIKNK